MNVKTLEWRKDYAMVTGILFAVGFLLYGSIGLISVLQPQFSQSAGNALAIAFMGGYMLFSMTSGLLLTIRIIGRRTRGVKITFAILFFVPVYMVMGGFFYSIPYGIYNLVKIGSSKNQMGYAASPNAMYPSFPHPLNTAQSYVAAINNHDMQQLSLIMTEDFVFVDGYGNVTQGRDAMFQSWAGYFSWFPNYYIEITDQFYDGYTVALFGYASGTYAGNPSGANSSWRIPAAWKVAINGDKVSFWQVVADSKIPLDSMQVPQIVSPGV